MKKVIVAMIIILHIGFQGFAMASDIVSNVKQVHQSLGDRGMTPDERRDCTYSRGGSLAKNHINQWVAEGSNFC